MDLNIKGMKDLKSTLEQIHKKKDLFFSLFFDERLVNKKYFTEKQLNSLRITNLVSEKNNYIFANYRVIKLQARKKYSAFIVTDKISYSKPDMVMPLHPENQFIVDDMKIKRGDSVLEIGVGSGVNSIFAMMFGAKSVIALDINPRTFEFTKFNIALNLPTSNHKKIKLLLNKKTNLSNIFDPVKNKKFDYIITNPPFEPTPPKSQYLLNSASGIYGLDVINAILKKVKTYLKECGKLQMVTFSPGDKTSPFMLKSLLEKYLGAGEIHLNTKNMRYSIFTSRFLKLGFSAKRVNYMNEQAKKDKVSHLYLSMIKYSLNMKKVIIKNVAKKYLAWDIPINSDMPMCFKPKKSKQKLE